MKYFHLLGLLLSSEHFTSPSYRIITPHTGATSSWNRGGKSRLASGATAELRAKYEQKSIASSPTAAVCSCKSSHQAWSPDPLRTSSLLFLYEKRNWNGAIDGFQLELLSERAEFSCQPRTDVTLFLFQIWWTYVAWLDFWNNLKNHAVFARLCLNSLLLCVCPCVSGEWA